MSADAGAVEVDAGGVRAAVVDALACVHLQVQPGDADGPLRPVFQIEHHPALAHDGSRVLRDLIAGRQVGIKIVLAVEHRDQIDLGLQRKPRAHGLRYAMAC